MAFAGWFYEDGEPVFDGNEPVIAATDPLIPEIGVFARFVKAPAEDDTESPADAPETASDDAEDDTESPANAPETVSDGAEGNTEGDTETPVGTPEMASADAADAPEGEPDTPADAPETASDDAEEDADAPVGTPEMASADAVADADNEPAEQDAAEADEPTSDAPAIPFDQSVTHNGVVITVKADAGTFPAGATLSVTRVLLYEQNQADAAVDEVRDEAQNVAARYTFDISILDEYGNALQPANGGQVEVSFTLAEAGDENLEANVYHITDDMTAEKLDAEATDEAVTAVTDGFSLYTVEFTYEKREYILPGDSGVALSEILDALGLKGAPEAVSVSAPELFSAEADAAGAWIVQAKQAFTSTEWMRVTIGGIEYEITVTDAMWEPITPALIYATVNIAMKDGARAALKRWKHTPVDGAEAEGDDADWTGGEYQTGRFELTFSRPVEIDQDGVEETVSGTDYVYAFTTTQEPQASAFALNVNIAARFDLTVTPAAGGDVQASCGGAPVAGTAVEGATIDLAVAPDAGYSFDGVSYTSSNATQAVTITAGTGSFTMPAGDTTVTATFALTDPEAKIGDTPYATLDAALAAANANDTIVLLKDITREKPVVIDKNLTLNLDGRTLRRDLTAPVADGCVIRVELGAALTVTDGTITGGKKTPASAAASTIAARSPSRASRSPATRPKRAAASTASARSTSPATCACRTTRRATRRRPATSI